LALADGSVTGAKIAGDAAIALTQLEPIARGKIVVGNASADGAIVDANDNGKILVGDGTDLNSVGVSGDVTLASTGAVTIANNAVQVAMLHTDVAASAGGLEKAVGGIQIKDDGIDPITKITGHADRKGQLISYDDSGDPEYVTKGTVGQVLKSKGEDTAEFAGMVALIGTNTDSVDTDLTFNAVHNLGGVPSIVRGVLLCTGDDLDYISGDEVDFRSVLNQHSGGYGVSLGASSTHCFAAVRGKDGPGKIMVFKKAPIATTNDDLVYAEINKTKWKIKVYAAL
jgi:phage gpG-like protein